MSGFVNTVSFERAQERGGNGGEFIVGFPIGPANMIKKLTYHLRDGFTATACLSFGLFNKRLVHS